MSFPRYESYKDSGVDWLGSVPKHWDVKRLKQVCEVFPSNVDKKTYENQSRILLCNYTDVYYNEQITPHIDFMAATASEDQIKKFTLRKGDTIITKDSETADDIAIAAFVPEDLPGVICGYHLSMVRPLEVTCGAFVKRLFDSIYVKSCCAVFANGLTRVGLGQYALDNLEIQFPPKAEQIIIATFLDRETAKIDALIAEQQRLIELLKEKRQAVISHAVTKGLNPDAPMKDSGIEWLGEVPAHWAITAAKRVANVFVPQRNKPDLNEEGNGVLWATMEDMKSQKIQNTNLWVSEEAAKISGSKILKKGAVIASCVGNFGEASINMVDLIINQQLQAYITKSAVEAEFIRYFIGIAKVYFEQVGTAATLTYVNQ